MATINSGNSTTLYSTTQTTTSVKTPATLPQDKVNETNFTTLYSNPSAASTGGGTSGNLLVSGNLRVLGTSDLEGVVTIGNSYRLPTSDGTANQVILTDGSGNLTFQNISAIANYTIQADTTTGGANLTLANSGTPVDSVKFAGGTNITVSRTDASTITISTVADNIPDGTARGQVLYWNGSAWTADSTISSSASADRLRVVYENDDAGANNAIFLRKDYTTSTYTTNDGVGLAFQLDSNSQATNQLANITATWNPTAPIITLSTNINNNTTGPFNEVGSFTTAVATLPGDLNVNGGNVNINGTAIKGVQPFLTFSTQASGANELYGMRGISTANDAWFVGSGSAGPDLGYLEIATGDNAGGTNSGGQIYVRQYNGDFAGTTVPWYGGNATVVNELILLDNIGNTTIPNNLTVNNGTLFVDATTNEVGINTLNPTNALSVIGNIDITGNFFQNGNDLYLNNDLSAADVTIHFTTGRTLKWSNANQQFELSGQVYVNQDLLVAGDNVTINSDKTDADVDLIFGRSGPVNATIRWNSTSDSFEWSADSSTYYDFIPTSLTAPFYNGQLISYRNGEWVNDNAVVSTLLAERSEFVYRPLSPTAGSSSSLFITKDYSAAAIGTTGVGTYTNGSGVGMAFGLKSDSQPYVPYGLISSLYSTTNPSITLNTSTDNFANDTQIASFDTNTASICATSVILDSENGAAGRNSAIYANRGSSGADAYIQWTESGTFWNFSNTIFSAGSIIASANLATNGNNIIFNNDGTNPPGDCFLQVTNGVSSGVNANIKWDDSNNRWQDTIDGTNYFNLPNQNLDTDDAVNFSSVTLDNRATIDTTSATRTSTTEFTLDITTRNAIKLVVYMERGTDSHAVEILIMRTTTDAMMTTYGEMYTTTPLATFTADQSAGSIRVRATPTSATSTTFSVVRSSLT